LIKKGLAGIAARAKRLMGGHAKGKPHPDPLLKEREMLGGTAAEG
jgi:hypothetical protein